MIGVFCALDIVLFYLFFEGALIPMFPDHRHLGGARIGSMRPWFFPHAPRFVLMLVAILAMITIAGTSSVPVSDELPLRPQPADLAGLAFFALLRGRRCRCGRSTPGCPTRTWNADRASLVILAGSR